MKKLIAIATALCLLAVSTGSHAQTATVYANGNVYMAGNPRKLVKAGDLSIVDQSLNFTNRRTKQHAQLDLSQIHKVRVIEGSYAGEYALYGGLSMAALSWLSLLQAKADLEADGYDTSGEGGFEAKLVLGFTAAGALIGGIWGAKTPKWKTLYTGKKVALLDGLKYNYDLAAKPDYIGLNLRFSK